MNKTNYKKGNTKFDKGFTIVETLVAITILMIAIAGPLSIASKSLNSALYSKDQMTASYLAQEGMELVRNLKDNAVATGANGFTTLFATQGIGMRVCQIAQNSHCSIYISDATGPVATYSICGANCLLYSSDTIGYVNVSGSNPSIFSRYFYVEEVVPSKEYRVTVVVTWSKGTLSNDVTISSEMTDAAL